MNNEKLVKLPKEVERIDLEKATFMEDSTSNVELPMVDEKLELVSEQYNEIASNKIPALQGQLDNIEQQKSNKTEVASLSTTVSTISVDVDTIKNKKTGTNDITEELKQQILGNTPLNTVPQDGSVTYVKLDSATANDLYNAKLKTNVFDEIVYGGEQLNGAIFNGNTITVPIGQTGKDSWRGFTINFSNYNRSNRLVGKRILLEFVVDYTNATQMLSQIAYNLNVIRESSIQNVGLNLKTINLNTNVKKYCIEYVVTSTDRFLVPYVQFRNATPITNTNAVIKILGVNYSVIDDKSINSYNADNLDEFISKKDYDNKIDRNTYKEVYNPYFRGQGLNGATLNNNVITIPVGQTGNQTYQTFEFAVDETLVGLTYKIECIVSVSSTLLSQITSISPSINVIRNGNYLSNVGFNVSFNNISGNIYKFTGEYKVVSGDTWVRPFIQINNSRGVLTNAETIALSEFIRSFSATSFYLVNPQTLSINSSVNALLPKQRKIINVKKDGSGNYNNLYDACINAKAGTDIYVFEGEYDIISSLPQSMRDNPVNGIGTRGVEIPDDVNIIGIGDKTRIILKGELSDTATTNQITSLSTLNMAKTCFLENLTVTAKNLRYAVHDESSNQFQNWTRRVKNCTFIHYGNVKGTWDWSSTWGEGCSSGSDSIFENCEFINYTSNPTFGVHNNTNFIKPSKHKYINCDFVNLASGGWAFRSGSMGSNVADVLDFVGCNFTGYFGHIEELNNGCGIDFKITGYANSFVEYVFSTKNNVQCDFNFKGECIVIFNNTKTKILKGTPLKKDGNFIAPMQSGDNIKLFCGIAMKDIDVDKYGVVKHSGYIRLGDVGLNGGVVGNNITIENGLFKVTNDTNSIGVITNATYFKLV